VLAPAQRDERVLTETLLEDDRWAPCDLSALAERAAQATLAHFDMSPEGVEIAVLGCDDARIAELNRAFRGKPSPTNVLSWPSEDLAPAHAGARPEAPCDPELGDIAISYDTCLREARKNGKVLNDHVTHLVVHGILHLLGYDHIRDPDATLMEETERQILGTLGIDDPY